MLIKIELNGEYSSQIIKYLKKRTPTLYNKKLMSGLPLRSEASKFYYDENLSANTARYYGNLIPISAILRDINENPIQIDPTNT